MKITGIKFEHENEKYCLEWKESGWCWYHYLPGAWINVGDGEGIVPKEVLELAKEKIGVVVESLATQEGRDFYER